MQIEKIQTGLTPEAQKLSVELLNKVLAQEFVIYVQTLNYHWNLTGPQFHDYHLLFDKQYHDLLERIDDVAERVRSVGGFALGSMQHFLAQSSIQEDTSIPAPTVMVERLLVNHETLIRYLRDGINKTAEHNYDMGTSNFMTDLMERHEKMAWMLRSLIIRK